VSSANLMLELDLATQSWVYRDYSRGLRTQPWGAPVFRVRGLEVCLSTLATWGLAVSKSRIQAHRGVFRPSSISLPDQSAGNYSVERRAKVNKQQEIHFHKLKFTLIVTNVIN